MQISPRAQDQLRGYRRPTTPPHPALALGYRKRSWPDQESRLKNALRIAARIVTEQGEEYLPIFKRIEDELKKEQVKQADLKRARNLAGAK